MFCHLEWGVDGARRAAKRGDATIIVDTLSFSTALTAAVNSGATVFPYADSEGAEGFAQSIGAEAAVRRRDVPAKGRFSLSPLTLQSATRGTRIVLPSPNGARCSLAVTGNPLVCAGAIVNASSVVTHVDREARARGCDVTIVACGEALDPYNPQATIRFALEDFMGAGAIAYKLACDRSPEVRAAVSVFMAARPNLIQELMACESGRELLEMGYPQDVEFAARLDFFSVVAVFDGEKYDRSSV